MGLARDIITLAFGLVLGAVALAVAIAFGIGGRDVAAQLLKEGLAILRARRSSRPGEPL
jgi:endonuclease YncB( thermonuclease family)